jgi:uncharacterized protein (DUF2384 family)
MMNLSNPLPVADLYANYQALVRRAAEVFGDEIAASRWLSMPSPDFNGSVPLDVARKQSYDPQVLEPIFTRIEHGIDF